MAPVLSRILATASLVSVPSSSFSFKSHRPLKWRTSFVFPAVFHRGVGISAVNLQWNLNRSRNRTAFRCEAAVVEKEITETSGEKFEYQAEVSRLLDLIVQSLYSHKEVFLREIVSNARDALDKLRFLSVTEPSLLGDFSELEIRIKPDPDKGTITIMDTGIGMTREELIDCLGTIAHSGTSKFLQALKPQYSALRHFPGSCLSKLSFGNGEKHGKSVQLKIKRTGENCCTAMMHLKSSALKVEQDLLRTYAWSEVASQRFFSLKGINRPSVRRFSIVGSRCKQLEAANSSHIINSVDGGLQVAVSNPSLKKGAPKTSRLGAKSSKTSKPKERDHLDSKIEGGNLDQSGKNSIKVDSAVSPTISSKSLEALEPLEQDHVENTAEGRNLGPRKVKSGASVSTSDPSKSSNSLKEWDHPDSNVKGLNLGQCGKKNVKSGAAVPTNAPSVAPEANGCPKTAQGKKHASQKLSITETGQASQTFAEQATGKKPIPTTDKNAIKNQKSKKMLEKSIRKRTQQTKASVPAKSEKAPLAKRKTTEQSQHSAENFGHQSLHIEAKYLKGKLEPLFPPTGKSVVVVESVTKAKVIQNYLGDMYEVLPSHGHVRDLAGRSGSVRPDDDFSMVWEVPASAWTHLKSIKVALNGAKNLILASDPDREGEAIAWHIAEMLQQQDALHANIRVARVVFHEITESAIKSSLQAPRGISANLVHAYLARRALDYLIGFSISPLLWRKLPGCQSAGRVQSAALALICDRETEIDEFDVQEYWGIDAKFHKAGGVSMDQSVSFLAHITHFDSNKLEKFSISSHTEAQDIMQKVMSSEFRVLETKRSEMHKNSPAPYITSSLQQDASNKLKFSASQTMKLAQKLYEGVKLSDHEAAGLITYPRTDGLHVSHEAADDIRSLIVERFGQDFACKRTYFKKVKNAQEAHEAIRPTNIRRLPTMLLGVLDEDCLQLYTLIWSRTMACQMNPAKIGKVHVDIGNAETSIVLRSSGSKVVFPGYQAVYKDEESETVKYGKEEGNDQDKAFELLCELKSGDTLDIFNAEPKQHFTSPPPHYTEGSLVKKLEELGIGRPSTYATIMKVLQARNYVTIRNRQLLPEFRGRMVSAFLSHFFSDVTDYSFTADMETELDNVSAGVTEWKGLLKDYWARFSMYCQRVGKVDVRQVEKMLEETFGHFLFSYLKNRTCPSCGSGTLVFKVSRFGAGYFIGCDQHPQCKYIAKTICSEDDETPTEEKQTVNFEPKLIGVYPSSNEKIFLKNGPYGFYIQLGEDRVGHTPKRASVSMLKDPVSISLDEALEFLRYPKTLGTHPEDKLPVMLRVSKSGLTVRHRRTVALVPKNMKPQDVTLEKALGYLSGKDAKKCGRRPKNKEKLEEAMEDM